MPDTDTDTNKRQPKQIVLGVLILLLFLLVSIQAWYMFNMKKQLDVIHKQQSSVPSHSQDTTKNKSDITEKTHTEATIKKERTEKNASSVQQNQNVQAVQPQNKSLTSDETQTLTHEKSSDTTFAGQTWNPYRQPERPQHERDRTLQHRDKHFTSRPYGSPGFTRPEFNRPDFQYHFSQNLSTPKMDIKEEASQYIVRVNLPDTDKNDISVTLNGQRLNVKGKQSFKKQNRDTTGNIIFQVRQSGSFQRSITLLKPVRQNEMKTRFDNHVLTITIPKVKNAQWR